MQYGTRAGRRIVDLPALMAQGKHTIWIPATAMISRTTNAATDA